MIGFAHRGAPRSRAEHNTLAAFERALSLGAGGLETDVALTSDGVPVLLHQGLSLRRSARVSALRREQLPAHVPSLADLYERYGNRFDLSLDMAAPRAIDAVVRVAEEHDALDRLWLTYWRLPALQEWRERWPDVRLVYPSMPVGQRRATRLLECLAAQQVDVLNVHQRFSSLRLAETAHEHGLLLFAWGIRTRRSLKRVMPHGLDGVYCDDVPAMVELVGRRECCVVDRAPEEA